MKKFFAVIPLQPEGSLMAFHYESIGNTKLEMKEKTCFPIIPAIQGYVENGEEFAVVVVVTNTEDCKKNFKVFESELNAVCQRRGIVCREIQQVEIEEDQRVAAHVTTFQKLIDYVDDDDELFCCMTFGTKPLSTAVMMAVQYAYRVKKNTSISCIVYGEIARPDKNPESWYGRVYDETALIQMDEIVRMLADRGVTNPKQTIDQILSL